MIAEEFLMKEREAQESLIRLHALGAKADDIAFIMSRDVYVACLNEVGKIYSAVDYDENGMKTGTHSVYLGYEVFVINEGANSIFHPAIKGFCISGFKYSQLSFKDFVIAVSISCDSAVLYNAESSAVIGIVKKANMERLSNTLDKWVQKDWYEKITADDTKELDEFMNSLVREDKHGP